MNASIEDEPRQRDQQHTRVRIELAAWLMIDEQEIKLSSPRLCGCRLLPRIYSPTLQQSTHAPASLIRQPQEAAFGILPSETSVIVTATPGTSEDQLLELEASILRVGSLAKQRRTAPIIAYNRELENIVKDTYQGKKKPTLRGRTAWELYLVNCS